MSGEHKIFTGIKKIETFEEPEEQKYEIRYYKTESVFPIKIHTTDEENLISDVKYALSYWNEVAIKKCQ